MEAVKIYDLLGTNDAIADCADFTRRTGREKGILLDARGLPIASKCGNERMIDWGDYEERLPNSILVHSHPNGSSFSEQDIMMTGSNGMLGCVACGVDGSRFGISNLICTEQSARVVDTAIMTSRALGAVLIHVNGWKERYGSEAVDQATSHWHCLAMRDAGIFDYSFILGKDTQRSWDLLLKEDEGFGKPFPPAQELRAAVLASAHRD